MMHGFKKFLNDDAGATAVEYGLIVALLAIAIMGAISAFGVGMSDLFTGLATTIG